MNITIIAVWITFCIVNAILGAKREIGSFGAFGISLIFSPLVGFLFVAFSKDNEEMAFKRSLIESQERIIFLLQKKKIDENEL